MTGDARMDTAQIGARVRYWRLRRGLNRQQFSARIGRSVSWLEKVETGERALLRLPMLEQVADALGVTPGALTDPVEAERAVRSPDAAEVAAIRGALGRYEVIIGAPIDTARAPQLASVSKQVDYLNTAFLASNFSSIGRHLPKLIVEAQRTVEDAGDDLVPATRLLVQTYRVASSTLLKLDANETAWLAAGRAITAAQRAQDMYCLARSTRSVARAMMSLGQTAEALDALISVARLMEPGIFASTDEVAAMYGMVLLAAEIAAAKLGDAATADTMREEASRIADARSRAATTQRPRSAEPTSCYTASPRTSGSDAATRHLIRRRASTVRRSSGCRASDDRSCSLISPQFITRSGSTIEQSQRFYART